MRPHLVDRRSLTASVQGQDHIFSFNHVFGAASTQQHVFSEVSELVQSSLDGFNVCIFAYGQTGAPRMWGAVPSFSWGPKLTLAGRPAHVTCPLFCCL